MLKGLLFQIQFLTRIPIPFAPQFNEEKFVKAFSLTPLVGLIIGFLLSAIAYLLQKTGLPEHRLVFSFIIVLAGIIITGGLHLDGLADTFDGIFSCRKKERILEIMRDSTNGTNGTLALILIIILKILLLSKINDSSLLKALLVMPVLSRMNLLWASGISSYARKDGLAKKLVSSSGLKNIIIATSITSLLLLAVFREKLFFVVLFIIPVILFVIIFVRYIKKRIGRITGDVLGAVIELSEIVFIVSFLVVQHYKIENII